jgi:hypothetical protein
MYVHGDKDGAYKTQEYPKADSDVPYNGLVPHQAARAFRELI